MFVGSNKTSDLQYSDRYKIILEMKLINTCDKNFVRKIKRFDKVVGTLK